MFDTPAFKWKAKQEAEREAQAEWEAVRPERELGRDVRLCRESEE